jgi:hypothetical protein
MKMRFSSVPGRGLAALGLAAVLLTTSGSNLNAASADSSNALVGVWSIQVTLRNCATGAPLGAPINSLVSFHQGGTMTETPGGQAFAPGQRSDGHGLWSKKDGHTYRQTFIALLNFDTPPNLPGTPTFDPSRPVSPGFFAGWQTVTHTLQLDDADHVSSEGTNAFYRTDGTVYRTGCSTAVGERFK